MDFIYRIPLLDFDPSDENKIVENWEAIKISISHSSSSFYKAIQHKSYEELSRESKLTVYKYLLRGKYRSTPFGRWSAVGIGSWQADTGKILDLGTTIISSPKTNNNLNSRYVLAQAVEESALKLRFWFFDTNEQKWAYGIVHRNKLVDLVLNHFSGSKSLRFEEFSKWFKNIDEPTVRLMWTKTIETGLIQSSFLPENSEDNCRINLKCNAQIQLSSAIKKTLDAFLEESGALFKSYPRPILEKFARLFHNRYDDRFISLDRLIHDDNLLTGSLTAGNQVSGNSSGPTITFDPFKDLGEIDLQKDCKPTKLPAEIHDIQLAFHLGKDNRILIDNIVCNRPFVFSGRFSEDRDIYELAGTKINQAGDSENIIFCDVEVFESKTINFISRHRNSFGHSLPPISDQSPDAIPLNEIYLGVAKGQLILVWRKANKQLIPVFQHPLNGSQITHPLFRLFWEISNQHSVKFIPYHPALMPETRYTPRLKWSSIILQEKKWLIDLDQFEKEDSLKKYLEEVSCPGPIAAGNEDRELILNWKDPRDFELLWEELKKRRKLTIYDSIGVGQSPFMDPNQSQLHPQFVYQKKCNRQKSLLPTIVNYLDEEDHSCLYFRIVSSPNSLLILLKEILPHLIQELVKLKLDLHWFFVLYSLPQPELRLRLLDLSPTEIDSFQIQVNRIVYSGTGGGLIYRAPYFPEFKKYSRESIKTSERIFQLESELMAFQHESLKKPLLCSSDKFKVRVLSETWTQVILNCPNPGEFMAHFKNLLKEVPLDEIRQIRAQFDSETNPFPIPEICSEYVKILGSHEYFRSKEKHMGFLLNHFHMMVNRFFPMNSDEFEDISHYVTYRKLGKAIHSKPS